MTTAPAWLSVHLLLLGLASILLACGVLAGLVAATKGLRLRSRRRRERHLLPYRPALLELAAGESDEPSRRQLAEVPTASWPTVQGAVMELLGKVKGEPAAELAALLGTHDTLQRARVDLSSRRAERRGRAALVLGRAGDREVLPRLVELLGDRDRLVRQAAATALGHLGDPAAAAPLLAAVRMQQGSTGVPSGTVVDALLQLEFGIEDALAHALTDPDPGVRAVAAEAVAGRATVLVRRQVREALEHETDATVRERLCRALGSIGDLQDVTPLARAAANGPGGARRAAAEALAQLEDEQCVAALDGLLDDPDRQLARTAALSLSRMRHPRALPALRAAADAGSMAAIEVLAMLRLRGSTVDAGGAVAHA